MRSYFAAQMAQDQQADSAYHSWGPGLDALEAERVQIGMGKDPEGVGQKKPDQVDLNAAL